MNFFEHQDRARGTTRKLVLLFLLAIASLIVITSFLVLSVLSVTGSTQGQPVLNQELSAPAIFLTVSVLVLAVVLLGAMFRMAQLRGGGKVVAESLGGHLLNLNTRDSDERKILNVVEEMAIASGMPVPPVYLLEDEAINAFAAGFSQEDAVIGITRGCIRLLNRDELQGVIAHEFSHIGNRDMRLNIRLMGWLYGIMVIGMIGYFILRGSAYHRMGSRGRDNKAGIMVLALGLVVIGYGGTFFGNLIKAAVSRQREFLADASAVQYTRNPDGIGGALKKIGMASHGSLLSAANVSEVSHMLFGQGVKTGFTGLFATHPPLAERIRRIQPGWDGNFAAGPAAAGKAATGAATPDNSSPAFMAGAAVSSLSTGQMADNIVASVGEASSESLQLAGLHLEALPHLLRDEAHSSLGGCLLMHCLIIANTAQAGRDIQLDYLRQHLQPATLAHCQRLLVQVQGLPRALHLTLLELCLPALKQLSAGQTKVFLQQQQQLIQADAEFSLFEWCLSRILQSQLAGKIKSPAAQATLERCASACEVLLSALCHAGQSAPEAMAAAFRAGAEQLDIKPAMNLRSKAQVPLSALEQAMQELQQLKPLQKPRLLKAMVHCIVQDGILQPEEGELLRAAGAILDCPVPPFRMDSGLQS